MRQGSLSNDPIPAGHLPWSVVGGHPALRILGAAFNSLFPRIPPGTWLANMLGGYLMGVALAYFGQHAGLASEWRLLVITGFLGGLTTFSTEVTTLI
jgi:fluoride ion exporter CrcB/FEX